MRIHFDGLNPALSGGEGVKKSQSFELAFLSKQKNVLPKLIFGTYQVGV